MQLNARVSNSKAVKAAKRPSSIGPFFHPTSNASTAVVVVVLLEMLFTDSLLRFAVTPQLFWPWRFRGRRERVSCSCTQ